MNILPKLTYKRVQQDEDQDHYVASEQQPPTNMLLYTGWIFASIFGASTLLLLFWTLKLSRSNDYQQSGSFGTGFSTEFGPAKPYIKEQPTMFWGGPRWHDNGTGYHINNPSEPIYVGPPSKAIDEAWESLIKGRYMSITEREAELTFGKSHGLYLHPKGVGYLTGLDVFHALHCLEQLRRALDRDYYFNKKTKLAYPDRAHRDHCIDHIRQQLMCHADLTPIPVIWYEGHGRSFVQSDVVHTCRDWNSIKTFMETRAV